MVKDILKERGHSNVYDFFNGLFKSQADYCFLGIHYSGLDIAVPNPDKFSKIIAHMPNEICKSLKENGNAINHYTDEDGKEGKLLEAIVTN